MIANRFPVNLIEQLLLDNKILKAQPGNKEMQYLMALWKTYVEPDLQVTCNLCYSRILANFKAIQPDLIAIVQEWKLMTYISESPTL